MQTAAWVGAATAMLTSAWLWADSFLFLKYSEPTARPERLLQLLAQPDGDVRGLRAFSVATVSPTPPPRTRRLPRSVRLALRILLMAGLVLSAWFVLWAAEVPPARPATPADQSFATLQQAFQSNEFARVRSLVQQFVLRFGRDPRALQASLWKAHAELKEGNESAARMTWNGIVANHPKAEAAAEALEQLVLSYERQNQKLQRDDYRQRLLQGFPTHPATVRVCIREAQARLNAQDYAGAAGFYQRVEKQLPPEELEKLRFAQTMASAKTAAPDALLKMANRHLEQNDLPQAIKFYAEYLQRAGDAPGSGEAKTKLGWCYSLQNQHDQAERLWRSVIAKGPANEAWVGESQWNMIRLLAGPKAKWEEAAQLCETVAKNFPKQFRGQQALFTRAWLYWVYKKWQPARAAFGDLLKQYPDMGQHPPIKEYIAQCDQELAKGGHS